jgi:hypothetical protein
MAPHLARQSSRLQRSIAARIPLRGDAALKREALCTARCALADGASWSLTH